MPQIPPVCVLHEALCARGGSVRGGGEGVPVTHSRKDPGGERVALVQIHVDWGGGRQGGQGRRRAALRGSRADPAGSQVGRVVRQEGRHAALRGSPAGPGRGCAALWGSQADQGRRCQGESQAGQGDSQAGQGDSQAGHGESQAGQGESQEGQGESQARQGERLAGQGESRTG